jgi:hypothetical protein
MLLRSYAAGDIRISFSNTLADEQLLELMENKLNEFLIKFRRDQEAVTDRLISKTTPSF